MKYLLAALMLLCSRAHADTTTAKFGFIIPTSGSTGWVNKVNDWVIKIDTGVPGIGLVNTFTSSQTFKVAVGLATTSGNVGVGTVSPGSKLDVAGNIRSTAYSAPSSGVGFEAGYTAGASLLLSIDRTGPVYKGMNYYASTHTFLTQQNAETLTILNNGNVGLGGELSPVSPLTLVGAFTQERSGVTARKSTMTMEVGQWEWQADSTSDMPLVLETTKASVIKFQNRIGSPSAQATNAGFQVDVSSFVILQNGNIGIGTAAPVAKLGVVGVVTSTYASFGDSSTRVLLVTQSNIDGDMLLQTERPSDHLKTGTNLKLQEYGGNVCVGCAAPDTKLHVVGSIKMVDGNQGNLKVMTSDVNGVGSWQAASAGFESVHLSTKAARITAVSWGTTALVCKSTLAVTGSTFTIHMSLSHQATSASNFASGYLVDGACPQGWTCSPTINSNVGPCLEQNQAQGATCTLAARENLAVGSHSFCVWSANSVGTTTSGNFLDFWIDYQ